ncbi:hypothetical protein LTR37_008431 [Vermiconidia calcicola]|uniref:Uncharacterized protein n=1 Tax=Vermiconidia calcicola TaxID=1690605 RepID=A0ACC3NC36_9PEZI|nr:hypothetical protein LTR37_008431 [Vermiconidia calcicola]
MSANQTSGSEPKWLPLLDDTTDRPTQVADPAANDDPNAANQQDVAAQHKATAAALVEQGKQIMDRLMQVSTPIQRANMSKVIFADLDNMYDAKVALLKELAETRPEEREAKKGETQSKINVIALLEKEHREELEKIREFATMAAMALRQKVSADASCEVSHEEATSTSAASHAPSSADTQDSNQQESDSVDDVIKNLRDQHGEKDISCFELCMNTTATERETMKRNLESHLETLDAKANSMMDDLAETALERKEENRKAVSVILSMLSDMREEIEGELDAVVEFEEMTEDEKKSLVKGLAEGTVIVEE